MSSHISRKCMNQFTLVCQVSSQALPGLGKNRVPVLKCGNSLCANILYSFTSMSNLSSHLFWKDTWESNRVPVSWLHEHCKWRKHTWPPLANENFQSLCYHTKDFDNHIGRSQAESAVQNFMPNTCRCCGCPGPSPKTPSWSGPLSASWWVWNPAGTCGTIVVPPPWSAAEENTVHEELVMILLILKGGTSHVCLKAC